MARWKIFFLSLNMVASKEYEIQISVERYVL